MSKTIVLFGELLMRLNTVGFERFVQSRKFNVYYTGAEANAGASLAQWGHNARVVSRVPAHEIGQACVNFLRQYGMDTAFVQRGGERLGILYVENGASQRNSKVIYDRKHSAFTEFDDEKNWNWDDVFKGAHWLHFSGTLPALSPRLIPVLERACQAAKKSNVTISCDLNFRKKLWSSEQANQTMSALMPYVDNLICNEEDAEMVFGIKAADTHISQGKLNRDGYIDVAKQLKERFNFKTIAITLRESLSASVNNWSALLYANGQPHFSKKYSIQIVDRVGGGDSFAAGLIHALCENYDPQQAIEFAVAASCLKHTIEGDFNLSCLDEINALLQGDGSGRIQR